MGIELSNWKAELDRIASGRKIDPDTPLPPSDDEVKEIVSSFRDAVLYLYNNTFRACGIACGDRQSENNSMKIYDVLCRDMDSIIGDELVEARRDLLGTLEAKAAKQLAAKAKIEAEIAATQKHILKLKELTQ